jgi:hypothetical protein
MRDLIKSPFVTSGVLFNHCLAGFGGGIRRLAAGAAAVADSGMNNKGTKEQRWFLILVMNTFPGLFFGGLCGVSALVIKHFVTGTGRFF